MKGRPSRFYVAEVLQFLSHLNNDKYMLPLFILLIILLWIVERWLFAFSNWVPLFLAVWVTLQYCSYKREILVEDLNKRWQRVVLKSAPMTPLESCEWMNKMLFETWNNFISPKFSMRFSSIVEKRLKRSRPRLIDKIELHEFSLGTCPPSLGLKGTHWSTVGGQRILHMDFNLDTCDMSILLVAKLAKPLSGTAKIVINSLHISGALLLMPVLNGRAILYSFLSAPQVRIGVAFGSGGSQSLPSTELPGVSSWLVKLFTDTLVRTMVEPHRRCFSLPAVDLRKKASGGIVHVSVLSGWNLAGDGTKMETFVEVEIGQLTRRTDPKLGTNPSWNSTFNMVLHEDSGIIRFSLFDCTPGSVKLDFLSSCEINMRYNADDSTTFWAVGADFEAVVEHAEICGKEVKMIVPFEGDHLGELEVKLLMKEWHFASESKVLQKSSPSVNGSSTVHSKTGRTVSVTVIEGKDLVGKDRLGKCDPYVRLKYGKATRKTKTGNGCSPQWNQKFEFDELEEGEYLTVKCYGEDTFGDENLGSARVNLQGLVEGIPREVWIPLEKVKSGEVKIRLEALKVEEQSKSNNGWIELYLMEARDLVAADFGGTSDPYVRVHYGILKKRTKVLFKTLNPRWNQTLEFPDDGSRLELHVKDYNSVLPTSSIGHCVVEYQRLPTNQMFDKWIPLEGVKRGEIHVQITRKVPLEHRKSSLDPEASSYVASREIRKMLTKLQSLADEANIEGIASTLCELESLQDAQEELYTQLETENLILTERIRELGEEMMSSSPSFTTKSFG